MAKSLGTLTLDLVARVGGFVNGMDQAARESEAFRNRVRGNMQAAGKAVGAFSVAAAAGLAVWIKSSIDAADEASKAAAAAGVQIEALTGLQFAADLAGVSNDDLNSSLARLNKTIDQAARGSKLQAAAFDDIGVSIRDANGDLKSADTLLLDVADAFSEYEDGAAKAALSQELFGRSGTKLIPLLNSGSEAITDLTDQAQRLGLVLDQETASAAEAFNDSLTVLGKVSGGVANRVTASLVPAMEELTGLFVDLATDAESATIASDTLSGVLKGLATVGVVIGASFTATGQAIGATAAALMQAAQGDFKGAWETVKSGVSDYVDTAEKGINRINKLWGGDYKESGRKAIETNEKIRKQLVRTSVATDSAAKSTKAATSAIDSQIASLQLQAATLGMTNTESTLYKLNLDKASVSQVAAAKAALDMIDAFEKQKKSQQEAADTSEYVQGVDRAVKAAQQAVDIQIESIGLSSRQAEELQKLNDVQQEYADKLLDLAAAQGTANALSEEAYQQRKEALQAAQDAEVAIVEEGFKRKAKAEEDWLNGAKDAFQDYVDNANNTAASFNDVFKNALQGTEDALVGFVQTGKLSFKSLADSIVADLLRIGVQKAIASAITSASGAFGGGGAYADAFGAIFGGGRATGGSVNPGSFYQVGEFDRPELIKQNGKQYMIPGDNGNVVPIRSGASSQQVNNIRIDVSDKNPRESRAAGASIARDVARAVAGSGRYT